MHKNSVSVPVDLDPVYFVCGPSHRGYSDYPARLVTKFKFKVVRERYHIYRSRYAGNSLGYRAMFIRDVEMSDKSLRALQHLYSSECLADSDLPF